MTDKEMAKEIFNTCAWRFGKPDDYKEIFNDIAEDLIKLNYRKLTENSVVLSRDNYNRLKRDSDLFEELLKKKVHLETVIELSNAQYEKVVEENKSLERLLSLIDDLPKEQLLDVDKHLEALKSKERKETAEKIYQELQGHGTTYVKKWIKEHYGVVIKE